MPIDNTKLKQLYDTLKQGGYKKDYNNFRTKFLGNENYPYRQKVFNLLSENGEDYGSTYGEFMQRMQVAKPTAASAAPKQPQQIDTLSTIQSARDTIFNPKAAVQPGGKVAQQAVKDEPTQDDAATKPFDVNQANAFVENMRLQNEVAQRQHQNVNDYLQHTAGQFGKNATRLGFKGQSNLGLPLAPKNQDGAFIDALGREYESETEARLAQTGAQHAREALTEANMQHNDPKNYLLEQKARIEKELGARSSQLERATEMAPSFATGVAGNAMTQAAARLTDKLQDTKYKALTMQLDKVNQALDTLDEAEHAKASDQWIADSSNWIERAGKGVLSFGAATGRSFKRQASKLSNWDFGFSDLAGGLAIYDAVDKADKGGVEALSPEQRKMLDLYAYNNHIQGENKEHLGWGNTAGTVTAQALPFMLEMALNPASGVGKFAQRKAMQWAIKKYGKEKLKQLAKRYLLAKAGTRIAGDWLGAATMSATTGQARVAADAVQRRIGEVETDIDNFGRVTYGGHKNGVDWGEAFGKAFLSNTIENQTEMAGDYFGVIGKAFSKGGQKALDKIGLGFVNDFMRNVSSTKVAKAVTDFENATHWNGTTGEYLEEVLGNVENALMVGDSTFDAKEDTGVFNVDKNIETFLSVAVMGGFFSAVKTASYTAPKKRALNEMADIGRQIDGMLGNNNAALEQWGTWRNTFINGTDEEKKQTLREVMDNQQLPMGFRMAFLEYTKAAQKYHGIAQAEQKRAEEGTLDPIGQALDQAFEEGYGTAEPTERQKAYRRLNETRVQVAQLLELEEGEDVDEAMGNDPIGYIHTLQEQGFTPEQIQPVMDYANAQATYEGVMQQREDSANEQADAVKREVRQITHRQTGQIQKATLDGGEREVYVLNGKVVLYPDGTGVDKQESDDVLYVQDVQTGELFTIAPNRISELAEATDPQAVIAEREEAIAAAMNQEIEQEEGAEGGTTAPKPTTVPETAGVDAPQGGVSATQQQQTAPTYEIGSRFTLDLPNGSAVNGVVLQVTPDGVEVQTSSPVNGRFVQVFPTDEFDGMLSSVRDEADDVIWSREVAEPVDVEEENQNDAAANGQQTETKNEKPTLSDVIATLYEKGKEYATKLFNRSFFDVAQTPQFMKDLGIRGSKFTIRYGVISRHWGKDNEHTLPREVWEQLPKAIQHPFAITKYYSDNEKKEQKGYRVYTSLQLSNGSFVVVSVEVKNAGRNIEVNAINTIFGRERISDVHDELIYTSETITPEQMALLDENNPHQYPSERESSESKDTSYSSTLQGNEGENAANGQQREMQGNGIPVDAKTGEPVYEAVAPDVAWDAIVQEAEGDEAMAMQVVTDIVADMEAKVQKAKKAKVRAGSSVREKLEAQKEHKRRIEEAEAQLEAWRRIAAVKAERIAAAERAKIEAADAEGGTERDKGRVGTENEGRGNKEKENDETEVIGSSMTADEALDFIADMELGAEIAPEIDLTIENWDALFGKEGIVSTPIGNVKMGENQFTKLMRQGRNGKLGMIKPTLEHPHAIIADVSEAKEGDITERASSYVFIRSFKKVDGSRYYYFTSITVSKDGKEVVISNQEKRRNAIANLLTKGKLVWKHADDVSDASDMAQGLYSSQGNVSDLATEGTDAPQTTRSSTGKDTPENRAVQTSGQENAETSSEGGISSISHAENQSAPAISLQSRGDVVSISNTTGKDTPQNSAVQTSKNDIVWPEPTVGSNANTDTAEVANNPTEVAKGETVDRGGNSSQPISSESKDTPQNSAVQTFGQENAETSLQSEVTRAEQQTNAEPTEGQKEAGNYKKGRVKVGPFDVVIEQPRGSVRSGVDANGKAWETTMQHTYGYFGGTKGVDGDAIDVFLAHDLDEWDGTTVFVVDQYNPDGSFDEHKVMLGFNSQEEAEAAYFANYEADWAKTHRTEVTAVPLADFTEWVKSSKRKTKAFAEYKVARRNAEIDAHNAQNEQLAEQLFSMAKEAETEKDFFDRAASLFEVTGYQSDLRDIYNGVKSGEIANARALSFYTNATLKPVAVETDSNQRNANDNLQQLYTLIDTALAGGNSSVDDVKLIRSLSDEELVLAKSYKENRKGRLNKAKIDVSNIRRHILDEIQERQNRKDLAKTEKESYIKGLAYFKKNVYPGFDFENYIKNKEKEYREAVSKGRLGYAAILKGVIRAIKEVRALAEQKESANETVKVGVKESEPKQATKNSKAGEKARKHAAQPGAPAVSTQEATLRDALVDVAQQSGLEVVVDEKAQQVLDEVNGNGAQIRLQAKLSSLAKAAKVIHNWIARNAQGKVFTIELPESTRRMIRNVMGRDFDSHNITINGIRHGLNNHGVEGKKLNANSIPIREEDAELIPYIMTAPDYVRKGSEDVTGRESVRFYKTLSNGYVVVVEKEYKNSPNDMETINIWAEMSSEATNAQRRAVPDTNVQNAILSTDAAKIRKDAEDAIRKEEKLREHRVFHGSGAEFDAFDHSHMGEGEGAQAYGWGTYVTEVEGIGRMYAESYKAGMFKSGFGDSFLEELKEAAKEGKFDEVKQQLLGHYRYLYDSEKAKGVKKDDAFISDYEMLERIKEEDIPSKFLYTVEIPEDNGENYLSWYEPLTLKDIKRIGKLLDSKKMKFDGIKASTYLKKREGEIKGFTAYLLLGDAFGYGQKPASEALMQAGYTGISYPAEARSGGRKDGARNFVIFNEKDAQITDHIRFFRTPGGEAYGFTVDGKIYLDPRIATAETPIHEYAHLWADMIRNVNAEAWNDIVGLMKATPIWEEVRGLYPELKTDDEIADEVLAHYSGRRGAERLRDAQQQAAAETGKSVFERAAAVAAIQRVKQALAKFWQSVAELFHIRFTSAEEVADRVLADMLNGVNPNQYIKRKGKGVQKLHLNDKTLAGIHNITEEKLRKALNLGGLANPSLAIIDTAQNKHEDFGEISLIAPSALVDKETGQTAGTWTTDAYTQRYPEVERVMSEAGYKKFDKWVESLDLTDIEKAEVRRQSKDSLENNSAPAWEMMYLREKGIDTNAYTSKAPYEWKQMLDTYGSVDELLEGTKLDEELQKKVINYVKAELSKPIKGKIREQLREQIKEETGTAPAILPPRYLKQVTEIFNRDYAKDLFGEDLMPGEEDVKKVMQHLFDLHNRTKHVDFSLSKSKASTYVHSHDLYSDYLRWQNKKLKEFGVKGRLFRGYSADGSRKYIPETLKNVSKAMVADANGQTNGGEMVSLGSFVAKFADRVDSADEMRANKKRLATNESKQGFYSEWMPTYKELADELSDDIFAGEQRLHDIAVQDNPVKYAKKEYGITLSKSFMDKLNAFKKAIREDMTSAYFETKFERPVYLNEFAAAVIPSDLSEDVKGGLEKSGIAIYEYDPKIEGDRDRATNAAFEADNRIRFQFVGQQGAAALDKAEEATTRLDNLGVAREMERQEKDAKAIKLATGWERGGDGKWRYEIVDGEFDRNGELHPERRALSSEEQQELEEASMDLQHAFQKGISINENEMDMVELYVLGGMERSRAERLSYLEDKKYELSRLPKHLDDYLDNEELYQAYPELRNVRIVEGDRNMVLKGAFGFYDQQDKSITLYSVNQETLVHEVQHAIQYIEGFAEGGSPNFLSARRIKNIFNEVTEQIKQLRAEGKDAEADALIKKNRGLYNAYMNHRGEAFRNYKALGGEVESRNVQKRLHMTPEERRQSLAEETEDVAREDQIFIMENVGKADSLGDGASFDEHQNEDLKAVNERFNEKILSLRDNPNQKNRVVSLGRAGHILQLGEIADAEIILEYDKLVRKSKEQYKNDHPFDVDDILNLPLYINDPIAIFKETNKVENSSQVILTELKKNGRNFIVVVKAVAKKRKGGIVLVVNNVTTLFPKDAKGIIYWLNQKKATYVNREKALRFIEALQNHSETKINSKELEDAAKVVENSETSQLPEENNFREGKGELSDDMLSYLNDPMAQMMGKPRGTKKQRAQFAERERGRMQAHAQNLVERLHLPNVEIVTDASQLEGKQRTAKGFYNKRTGKITIVLPNHASTADVEQTLLHEAVAHYGLRQLFGEHFDDFLDMVYRNAEEGIRRKIAEASAKHGWNVRTATEEYLADLAERTDFEHASPQWWAKIKDFFLDMLRGLGFEAMDGQTLTDNELRYVLWCSYENLTEPGKYPTFIAEARDVAKQHALQVGRFAPTETAGGRVAENKALSEEETAEILFRDGNAYQYTQVLARDRYERRIKSGMYQTKEALQDSMLGLRTAMESILEAEGRKGVYIEDIDGFENAYLGENRLSSVNQAEAEKFAREVFAPMLEEVSKLAPTADERAKLIDYLFAKHGLERNEVMARRAAAKEARKEFEKELRAAERAVAKDPLDLDAADALDDVKQRMQEREDALYSKNRQTDYAGLTTLTGKAAVADAELMAHNMVAAYENAHDTNALWDAINTVTQRTLKKSFDTGMISRDTYDDIRSMYQFYIPLRGFDERTSNEEYAYLGGTESVFISPIKTAKGRRSKADDPLAYMQMMAESAIAQGNRNQLVKQKLLNFALNHPSDLISVSELWLRRDPVTDQWSVVQPGDLPGTDKLEDSDTAEMVSQKMEQFEQVMQQLMVQNPDDFVRQKDRPDIPYRVVNAREMQQHQVMVKRNGKTYVLTINGNPRAAQAVNGLTNPNNDMSGVHGAIFRAIESGNRWLSGVYTTRNPDFVLTNLVRDGLYTNTMVWLKEDASYALSYNWNYAVRTNPLKMIRLYNRLMKGKLDLSDPTEMLFRQFIENGGETGYTAMRDLEAHKTQIKKELRNLTTNFSIRKAWRAIFDVLDLFNRAAENSARFAAFITSREAGRTLDRSIYDAKEISVNFNKKGAGGTYFKAEGQTKIGTMASAISGTGRTFFAFWNAAIQGSTNFGRVVKRHPKKALTAMAIMFALGLANAMVGASGDDDDDAEEGNGYFDHPSNTRRSNLMFRINGKSWASIPLPVEYRAVYGMGELLGSVMSGKERYTNQELAHEVLCQVSQVLPLDVVGEGSGAFVPTAVKPLYEVVTNESWTGLPIYKQTVYNERDPAYTKAYSNTNKQLVGMSKMLNELSGGDSQKSGWLDVNPAVVEHLGRGYLGGYFNLVDKLVKTGETVVGSREYDPSNLLIVNRFVKSGSERTAYRAINNRYYQIKADSEELIKDYKGYN